MKTCQHFLIDCPIGCKAKIARGEVSKHRLVCPEGLEECKECSLEYKNGKEHDCLVALVQAGEKVEEELIQASWEHGLNPKINSKCKNGHILVI